MLFGAGMISALDAEFSFVNCVLGEVGGNDLQVHKRVDASIERVVIGRKIRVDRRIKSRYRRHRVRVFRRGDGVVSRFDGAVARRLHWNAKFHAERAARVDGYFVVGYHRASDISIRRLDIHLNITQKDLKIVRAGGESGTVHRDDTGRRSVGIRRGAVSDRKRRRVNRHADLINGGV
ncbi:MAG: hypothetical protein ACD_47C00644G0001 [uncultured bacterium]|nr:MAG: hypothetical protein ACD_47C00644G0001 [uncultured bacterium]